MGETFIGGGIFLTIVILAIWHNRTYGGCA